jgi:hypothetical protein
MWSCFWGTPSHISKWGNLIYIVPFPQIERWKTLLLFWTPLYDPLGCSRFCTRSSNGVYSSADHLFFSHWHYGIFTRWSTTLCTVVHRIIRWGILLLFMIVVAVLRCTRWSAGVLLYDIISSGDIDLQGLQLYQLSDDHQMIYQVNFVFTVSSDGHNPLWPTFWVPPYDPMSLINWSGEQSLSFHLCFHSDFDQTLTFHP